MDPHAIAKALGGTAYGNRISAPGPGHSTRDRSLSIKLDPDAPDGFLVHSFAGDDPMDCKDYVRQRAGLQPFSTAPKLWEAPVDFNTNNAPPQHLVREYIRRGKYNPPAAQVSEEERNRDLARRIWREAVPPRDTLVETYLRSRGLTLTPDVLAADVLRFHPECPFGTERLPTMVALMRDAVTNDPRAIHRTALKQDGSGKAELADGSDPKKMLGPARNAVVKLAGTDAVPTLLGIAEGIETTLTPICLGWGPVWACGSAGAIKAFPVLSGVEALTIFADADENQAGQDAARACAQRWADAGREAKIILPPDDDSDWNDIWRASTCSS